MPTIPGKQYVTVKKVIRAYLMRTAIDTVTRIRFDEHKLWAIMEILSLFGDRNLTDWTIDQMRKKPVGVFPFQSICQVAQIGATDAVLDEIILEAAKTQPLHYARNLAQRRQRQLTIAEVEAICDYYTTGAMKSDGTEKEILKLVQMTQNAKLLTKWNADLEKMADRFSTPY